MLAVIINLSLVFLLGVVVALDAHCLNSEGIPISTTPPLLWAIVVWLIAIIGLPLYLYSRTKALEDRHLSSFHTAFDQLGSPAAVGTASSPASPPAPPPPAAPALTSNTDRCVCGSVLRPAATFCAACGRRRP